MDSSPDSECEDVIAKHFLNGLKGLFANEIASDRTLHILEIDEACHLQKVAEQPLYTGNSVKDLPKPESQCENEEKNGLLEIRLEEDNLLSPLASGNEISNDNIANAIINEDANNDFHLQESSREPVESQVGSEVFKELIPYCSIPVHSVILALHSTFFENLFSASGMIETNSKDVTVKVTEGDGLYLKHLIHAFYDQSILLKLSKKDLLRVLEVADQFSCDAFINRCLQIIEKCIISSVQECNEIVDQLTRLQNRIHLLKIKYENAKLCCVNFLVNKFCPLENKESSDHDEFQQLSYHCVLLLVQSRKSFAWDENSVLFYLAFWLDFEESRQTPEYIGSLLKNLNYQLLNPEFLYDAITPQHQIFSKWAQFGTWFLDVISYHSFPNRRKSLCSLDRQNNFDRNFRSPDLLKGWKVRMEMSSPLSFVPDACFSVFCGYFMSPRLFLKKGQGNKKEYKISLQLTNSSVLSFSSSLLHHDVIGQEFVMAITILPVYENYDQNLFHRRNHRFIEQHFREVTVQLHHRTSYCDLDLGVMSKDFLDASSSLYVAMAFRKCNEIWPASINVLDLNMSPLNLSTSKDYSLHLTGPRKLLPAKRKARGKNRDSNFTYPSP